MRDATLDPTDRTTIHRHGDRGSYDRELIYSILDEAILCHVGFAVDGRPNVIPMACARLDDHLILHGSVLSRLMRHLADGLETCVSVTHVDGLVLARSSFHSSMNYRSVVLFGVARPITDREEKRRALDALVDHLIPGRAADARPSTDKEIAATEVLTLAIDEASAKVRSGPPHDPEHDVELDVWAGVVPLTVRAGAPEPAPDLPPGIAVPDYVTRYRRPGG